MSSIPKPTKKDVEKLKKEVGNKMEKVIDLRNKRDTTKPKKVRDFNED